MDWGSASPFCVLWGAVCSEDLHSDDGYVLPRGAIVIYREWYGSPNSSNQGLKLTAEQVADGVIEREQYERARNIQIANSVIDPNAFARNGGPSLAERMIVKSVMWRAADNTRVGERGAMGGWDQLRGRLNGEGPMRPMFVVFETCPELIRTLPALQHDPDRPEDVLKKGEDHAPDTARYMAMSRPWVAETPVDPLPFKGWEALSLNELWDAAEKKRRRYEDA